MKPPVKLHLGCGKRDFGPDWIHVDGAKFPHIKLYDVTKLELKDNTVDVIYNAHMLEYLDRDEVINVLAEWMRVLKPGGVLRTAVPDFEAMVGLYKSGHPLTAFLGPLYGKMKQNEGTIFHKTTYDYASLSSVLQSCGFVDVQRYDWRDTEHAAIDDHSQAYIPHMDKTDGTLISLNVECKKP